MYQRKRAVDYALAYGKMPNEAYHYFKIYGSIGGDCTNFTSQCLFAGRIPQVRDTKTPWYYESKDKWSISWINSHSLYWRLKIAQEEGLAGPRGIEVPSIDNVGLGDIIFYESHDGIIDHSAIITGYRDNLPAITQHSPEAVNVSYVKTNKGKMHFIKVTN